MTLLLLSALIVGSVEASIQGHGEILPNDDVMSAPFESTSTPQKKRILIFTDPGGGGHLAASRAVESILGQTYELKVVTPLMYLPFVKSYNTNQKAGNLKALRFLTRMQPFAEFLAKHFGTRTFIKSEIKAFKPDLIISVIPLVNRLTLSILEAEQLNIPLLILTTDLEVQHFFRKMKQPGPSVRISLAFDDEKLKAPLRHLFSDANFVSLGFPLRPEFGLSTEEQQPKINALRNELGIKESDKTILIMMGAQGVGDIITKYSNRIAESHLGSDASQIHVIALCGGSAGVDNGELIKRVQATTNPNNPHVIIHALGIKPGDTIAALMRFAHVLISKPGGSSVNEAFASELYTLYYSGSHASGSHADKPSLGWSFINHFSSVLPWEEGNMNYSIQNQWGERLEKKTKFIQQLERVLNRPRLQIPVCPGKNFKNNLQGFVAELLST